MDTGRKDDHITFPTVCEVLYYIFVQHTGGPADAGAVCENVKRARIWSDKAGLEALKEKFFKRSKLWRKEGGHVLYGDFKEGIRRKPPALGEGNRYKSSHGAVRIGIQLKEENNGEIEERDPWNGIEKQSVALL